MARVTPKGGTWKYSEDEILKAGVMKYGENQWSRIASLLHHKSADRCKARWFDWLDPSIKKTEWSRNEDEKLLHMAKLMPSQWRTIAPMVHRTAAQCFERYEFLFDQVQRRHEGLGGTADNPRSLLPGQIDPDQEMKPARPEPIDMDEDEVEMCCSPRPRLLNTRSKKTKRKAREKQLEVALRLALLQKRRELHAASIEVQSHISRKHNTSHNMEIPFEKSPVTGFYPTADDSFDPETIGFEHVHIDHRNSTGTEEEERQTDEGKLKRKREDLSTVIIDDNRSEPIKNRSELVLPTPQISDTELEQVAKFERAANIAEQRISLDGTIASIALLDI